MPVSKRRESQKRYDRKTCRFLIKIPPSDTATLKAWQEHRAKFNDNMAAFRDLLNRSK